MKSDDIELGLAVLSALAEPGRVYSHVEIAAFCDCTPQTIHNIEKRALANAKKLLSKENVGAEDVSA